jgi:glycosyltransferase involved in cell wall biosynthesis
MHTSESQDTAVKAAQGEFLSIVIPSYNEEENLEAVVQESLNVLQSLTQRFEIIVVDDCSTDNSWQKLQHLSEKIPQLRPIRNEKNMGCHPSSLVGYQAAQGDYRYFIPADRQIPAAEITKFVAQAKSGCDIVYSWRQRRADPPHRLWISGCYNLLLRIFFGIRVHDVDSSELLTKRAVETILPKIRCDSAFITVEMLMEASRQGLGIGEVIIEHRPRVAGVARGINLHDLSKVPVQFLRMLLWFWKQRFQG